MGARDAVNWFAATEDGDVLLTWENEALLAVKRYESRLQAVYPSRSILAEPVVALVEPYVDDRGSRRVTSEFIAFLFSEQGQAIAVRNLLRARGVRPLASAPLQQMELFPIPQTFGTWQQINQDHFGRTGLLSEILKTERTETDVRISDIP
jgi:sulfate transport system substrate-binding protein